MRLAKIEDKRITSVYVLLLLLLLLFMLVPFSIAGMRITGWMLLGLACRLLGRIGFHFVDVVVVVVASVSRFIVVSPCRWLA